MQNIAIFASGEGTNAEHLIRRFNQAGSPLRVALVVYNRPQAAVVRRAQALGVPAVLCSRRDFEDRTHMMQLLHGHGISFIALCGFLLLLPPYLVQAFPGRIVNIHPSLLPLHSGKGMYGIKVHEDVLHCGDGETGITIHLIDEQYDRGRILLQARCPVLPDDTAESLARRVHQLEYEHYADTIARLAEQLPTGGSPTPEQKP
ncbi:MAG: phosphoribosylglycinamide formyltransferase [Bacteroidaceae bacterium]|nr:phosphoribosylglycinamide formyltransferase [Bacteroidaceae bacterium]